MLHVQGDEASPSISLSRFLLFSENAHVKDGHICDKKQVFVSREVTAY